jgi:hypothetical protein
VDDFDTVALREAYKPSFDRVAGTIMARCCASHPASNVDEMTTGFDMMVRESLENNVAP